MFQLAQQSDGSTIHTVQGIDTSQDNMTVDLTEATLGQDGQIIITGEDGQGMMRERDPRTEADQLIACSHQLQVTQCPLVV